MNTKTIRNLSLTALLAALVGCVHDPYHHAPYYDDYRYYDYPLTEYDYYYYPHTSVYFHIHSGDYYYRHDGRWVRGRSLPKHIYLDQRERRHLTTRDREPYHQHPEHRQRYQPRREFHADQDHDRSERQHNHNLHERYRERIETDRRDYREHTPRNERPREYR